MGLRDRLLHMNRPALLGLMVPYVAVLGLGGYEVTAKSPALLGGPLPGWRATVAAEKSTRWDPPTGILPLDKLLHEGEEALRFYRILPDRS